MASTVSELVLDEEWRCASRAAFAPPTPELAGELPSCARTLELPCELALCELALYGAALCELALYGAALCELALLEALYPYAGASR